MPGYRDEVIGAPRRRILQIVLGSTLSAALVVGAGFAFASAVGVRPDQVALGSGSAWFGSARSGSVALLDGSSGSRVTRVAVGPGGHPLVVTQLGSSAVVVDQSAGTAELVDGRTFVASEPRQLARPNPDGRADGRLRVFADGGVVWAVLGGGQVVQELDPVSLEPRGAAHNLPGPVSGAVVTPEGSLWVSWASGASGGLRSFAGGRQRFSASTTAGVLVAVEGRPVLVEPAARRARVIDTGSGELGSDLCLDVSNAGDGSPPLVAASSARMPFVFTVDRESGALVSSPINGGLCRTVSLDDPASAKPTWGEPVVRNGLVFVPDESSGIVAVVDPVAGRLLKRVNIRVEGGAPYELLSHGGYVWFDETTGDRAGVITDDLEVLAVSKTDGPASGETPQDDKPSKPPAPAPLACSHTPPTASVDQAVTFDAVATDPADVPDRWVWSLPGGDPATAEGPQVDATFSSAGTKDVAVTATTGGGNPRTASCPVTIGDTGPATPPSIPPASVPTGPRVTTPTSPTTKPTVTVGGGANPGGAGQTTSPPKPVVDFSWTPQNPKVGDQVTFTDLTTGTVRAVAWQFPSDATPSTSTSAKPTTTFATAGPNIVTLTVTASDGTGIPKQHTVTVGRPDDITVPDVTGKTEAQARSMLTKFSPVTAATRVNSLFADGQVASTNPAAGTLAQPGSTITLTLSNGQPPVTPGVVATFAGTPNNTGSANGPATSASFDFPEGVAVDGAGTLYVTDSNNNTIRKITAAGVVSTLAGTPGVQNANNGLGAAAGFHNPLGIAVDGAGTVYVADYGNQMIRKITAAGNVTTLAGNAGVSGAADGIGTAATFNNPSGITVDGAGNLYVTDAGGNTIRMITPAGVVTTIAGTAGAHGSADGTGAAASFWNPIGIAVDTAGNLYVADTGNQTIRKITVARAVSTIAGTAGVRGSTDGIGAAARFSTPSGVAVDSAGNVYVVDSVNDTIRRITPAGAVGTLAGTVGAADWADGTGAAAHFNRPDQIAVDSAGTLYVADPGDSTVRKITF